MKNMSELLKQAQAMQQQISQMQKEMAQKTVSATSGGGMVAVTANGANEIISIKIEKEIINPDDPEMLADLVLAAVNEALKKSQELVSKEMGKVTGGFNLPF